MAVNRISLPGLSESFMNSEDNSEVELDVACESVRVLGEAGYPLGRVHFAFSEDGWMIDRLRRRPPREATRHEASHSRETTMATILLRKSEKNGGNASVSPTVTSCPSPRRAVFVMMMHPSDPPTQDVLFSGLGFHRVIDAFPQSCVGYLYCCGTRGEGGGQTLVLDEINNYGRKGRIFEVHFRNLRGSFASARGFEEVLLDDGDMNRFRIVQELHRVGFDGCLNADHYPSLEGDASGRNTHALAYSVGYMKAILAALAC